MSNIPEFIQEDDGTYNVLVRFRTEQDYHDFIKLIYQPKLKVYNKTLVRSTTWPEEVCENNLFEICE